MIQTGRLCVKIAGRDAGKKCVILTESKDNRVLIDGETRRRLCNVTHLEPLPNLVEINKEASHEEVKKALEPLGIKVIETKAKKSAPRPRTLRRSKLAAATSASKAVQGKKTEDKSSGKVSSAPQTPEKKASDSAQKKSHAKPKAPSAPAQAGSPDSQASKTSA